jgi:hypothetical protein
LVHVSRADIDMRDNPLSVHKGLGMWKTQQISLKLDGQLFASKQHFPHFV